MLHELGHGLGLDHPFDAHNGTTKIAEERHDAEGEPAYDNQRYTVMSYEEGGWNQGNGQRYGHAVTPMALDIAALQNMYGAVSKYEGANTYRLTDEKTEALDTDGSDGTVTIGRAFYCIWDTGGIDTISYSGLKRAVLNLNNASLSLTPDARTEALVDLVRSSTAFKSLPEPRSDEGEVDIDTIKLYLTEPEYNAAGNFSTVFDSEGNVQLGGYSIASDKHDAGAKIENAVGGSGGDIIIGNEVSNSLKGNGGSDLLLGSSGRDTLEGGAGNDELGGGEDDDVLDGGAGTDIALFSDVCTNYELSRNEETGVVTVRHVSGRRSDGVDTLKNMEQARFKDGTIDLTAATLGCPSIDFVFLVDLSGSFSDDLPNFVASAPAIFDAIQAEDPNAQFAIASFIDLPVSPFGSPGDYVYRPELSLTSDLGAFREALSGLSTRSGGDRPEAQWAGLWAAANGVGLGLRENSRKIVLIATDAPAHSASDYGLDESTIRQFLREHSIDTIGGSTASDGTTAIASHTGDGIDGDIAEARLGAGRVDPTDVGDTNPAYAGDAGDPLVGEVFSSFVGNSTVLFAVTSDVEAYYERETPEEVAAAVAPLARSGEDIADAVRLALASVAGEVTEKGGNDSDDVLVGTIGNDGLFGLGGNDTILGLAGDDVVDGGEGDDNLHGGEGNDDIRGGTGNDVIFDGLGDDRIDGGDGKDRIFAASGSNTLRGGTGDDLVSGGVDDDRLFGNAGDDILVGGRGHDILDGGAGSDTLLGLSGQDTFVFGPGSGSDFIEAFSAGEDLIDLRQFTGITGLSDLTVVADEDGTSIYLYRREDTAAPAAETASSDFSGDVVRLKGFTGSLSARNFLFAEASPDDFAADTTTTGSLSVGSLADGNIETAGDRDWFAVELVAGRTYRFELEGAATGSGTLEYPVLRGVYDFEGHLISATGDDDS